MSDDQNPYAAPPQVPPVQPIAVEEQGAWRHEGTLIVRTRGALLPGRCVKCNAPVDHWVRRKLSWHHPALYILILAGIFWYVVLAVLLRKTAQLHLPLCSEHRSKLRRSMLVMWMIILAAAGMWVLAAIWDPREMGMKWLLFFVGALTLLVGVIYGLRRSRVLKPIRIDDNFAWLKGASPQFLSELPVPP